VGRVAIIVKEQLEKEEKAAEKAAVKTAKEVRSR
jgi:hypothetical protein